MAWQWRTHPQAFGDLEDAISADPLPLADAAMSTTVVFPKPIGAVEELRVEGLEANFSTNTAESDVTFWICHMSPGEEPIGAAHDPGQECADIEEFKSPMRFRHGTAPDSDYLFVTLTPTRSGVTKLQDVAITYQRSDGPFDQSGTQVVRAHRTITVS